MTRLMFVLMMGVTMQSFAETESFDKAAVGTVSLLILWPLAITAGMGAWEQMKMPERIFDYVGSRLKYC